jgi:hypothetical protein
MPPISTLLLLQHNIIPSRPRQSQAAQKLGYGFGYMSKKLLLLLLLLLV